MVKVCWSESPHQFYMCHLTDRNERERERNVLFNDAHFIYGYMATDIWLRTILIVRKETRCRHIGYSYRLTARVLLYAPSHRQETHTTAFVTPVVKHWLEREIAQWVHPMKDRSDDPSHHERTLYLWATSRSFFTDRNMHRPTITFVRLHHMRNRNWNNNKKKQHGLTDVNQCLIVFRNQRNNGCKQNICSNAKKHASYKISKLYVFQTHTHTIFFFKWHKPNVFV